MTFDEFFDQLPSQQSRELSNDDLIKVFKIAKNSVTIFKVDDNTLTKREKVNQYKTYCRDLITQYFKDLTPLSKIELDNFFVFCGNHFIIEHLIAQ